MVPLLKVVLRGGVLLKARLRAAPLQQVRLWGQPVTNAGSLRAAPLPKAPRPKVWLHLPKMCAAAALLKMQLSRRPALMRTLLLMKARQQVAPLLKARQQAPPLLQPSWLRMVHLPKV